MGDFAWRFSANGDRITVLVGKSSFTMTTAEVRQLVVLVAMLRIHMKPEAPAYPEDASHEELLVADAYAVRQGSDTTHVWSRVPGIGWIDLPLSAEQVRRLTVDIAWLVNESPAQGPVLVH